MLPLRTRSLLVISVAAALALSGCQPSPPPPPSEPLPTLDAIRPKDQARPALIVTDPPPAPQGPPPPRAADASGLDRAAFDRWVARHKRVELLDRQRAGAAVVTQIELPLDAPIDLAWAHVEDQPVDPETAELWRTNGLRVGVLTPTAAAAFREALPPDARSSGERVTTFAPTPVVTFAGTDGPREVVLALAPGEERTGRLRPGRFQFLLRVERLGSGAAAAELTPHHAYPQVDLVTREAWEEALEGRIFDSLALRVELARGAALVVALDQGEPAVAEGPAEADELEGSAEPGVFTPPREPRLGDLLLTGSRGRQAVQRVVVVAVGG